MMTFSTHSQSIYQVDLLNSRIRRLRGEGAPPPRLAPDGEWKEFSSISEIVIGKQVGIVWPATMKSAPGTIPATVTSKVAWINRDESVN